jgi:hypothetical protein
MSDTLSSLRTWGYVVLSGADARRSKALEIRREARAAGLDLTFKSYKLRGRSVIELRMF